MENCSGGAVPCRRGSNRYGPELRHADESARNIAASKRRWNGNGICLPLRGRPMPPVWREMGLDGSEREAGSTFT